MCGMKNHVSPENFSFVAFPGHQFTDPTKNPGGAEGTDSGIDEGEDPEDAQDEDPAQDAEWTVEKPAQTLPARESPVFDAYDVAELYEAYARRSWYPFHLIAGTEVSSARWSMTPTLASDTDSLTVDGLAQYPQSRNNERPTQSNHHVISALVKAFLDVSLSGTFTPAREPIFVFLDPEVALPGTDPVGEPGRLSVSDYTTSLLLDTNPEKPEPSANPVVNEGTEHVRKITREKLRSEIPFVSVASREIEKLKPVNVTLPKDPETDRPVDSVASSSARIFRSGPEKTRAIPGGSGGSCEIRIEDQLAYAYGFPNDDGTSTGISVVSPMAEWFAVRQTFYTPATSEGEATSADDFFTADLKWPEAAYAEAAKTMSASSFFSLGLLSAHHPSAIPVSSLIYGTSLSPSPLDGYNVMSLDVCPRAPLTTAFSDSDEVHKGLSVSGSPTLSAAVKAWSAPAPALVLPLFEWKPKSGGGIRYGFPPPYGWERTEASSTRGTDAPFLDVSANGFYPYPIKAATSFSVPVEARRLVIESLGKSAERLTRTVTRLRSFPMNELSVEAVLDYRSDVTTKYERVDRFGSSGSEPTEAKEGKTTYEKCEYITGWDGNGDGGIVVALTSSGGFYSDSAQTPFALPCCREKIHARREQNLISSSYVTFTEEERREDYPPSTTHSTSDERRNLTVISTDDGECHVSLSKFRVVRDSKLPRGGYLSKCIYRVTTGEKKDGAADGEATDGKAVNGKAADGDAADGEHVQDVKLGGVERGTNVLGNDNVPEGIIKSARLYALVDISIEATGRAQKDEDYMNNGSNVRPSSDPTGYRIVNDTTESTDNARSMMHWERLVDLGKMDGDGEFPGPLNPFDLIGEEAAEIAFSSSWSERVSDALGSPWRGGVSFSKQDSDSKLEGHHVRTDKGTRSNETSSSVILATRWDASVELTWRIKDWFLLIDWDFEADVMLELGDEEKGEEKKDGG